MRWEEYDEVERLMKALNASWRDHLLRALAEICFAVGGNHSLDR